jgi:allantoin racemase
VDVATILIINPTTTASMTEAVVAAARPATGARLIGSTATRGVDSVESHVDEVWGAVSVLESVLAAEEAGGIDGYVIACFGDTGLGAAREAADGPVVGMTEAALFTAALLAARFAIITMPPRTIEMSHRVLHETGLTHRCTVRAIAEPVSSAALGSLHLLEPIAAQARLALQHDGAEAIILGCSGLADLVGPLQELLGVPVIDGVAAAVTMVEGLLAQGLQTSRANCYAPPERLRPR